MKTNSDESISPMIEKHGARAVAHALDILGNTDSPQEAMLILGLVNGFAKRICALRIVTEEPLEKWKNFGEAGAEILGSESLLTLFEEYMRDHDKKDPTT